MAYRIALIGGGTGGHVYPLIAVAKELKKQALEGGMELDLRMFGEGALSRQAAVDIGVPYKNIPSAKWRRYFSLYNFLDLLKIPLGVLQSLYYMWLFMPDVVFSKGGHVSLIPSFIAKMFMIPIVIHESDSVPGKTSILLSRLALKIFVSFDKTKEHLPYHKVEFTGNPIRKEIVKKIPKENALKLFKLSKEKPVIFVMGGSQGAQLINQAIIKSIVEIVKDFQVIHQAGTKNVNFVQSEINKIIKEGKGSYGDKIKNSYHLFPFLDVNQISYAYSAADVIISRAGAGSLFEIAIIGKPAIVIPITNSASNHQLENAKEFSRFGGVYIEEANITRHILIEQIKYIYINRQELSIKISKFAKPEAAEKIAQYLLYFKGV